ncbi:MAG: FecR family protein, partial [bacterium]
MRRSSITLLLALVLTSTTAAGTAHGQETAVGIAWLRSVAGRVEVRPAGSPPKPFVPVSATGLRLTSGDTIRTGRDGRVVIQFTDGSRIYCFEETEFTVTEAERSRTALGVEVERYRSRLVKVARGSLGLTVEPNERLPTEVQSPTVVIGIRGTVVDPFQVNRITGETRVGLKRGRAWGYTPDGQAAFRIAPGLVARLGRDAKGRPTV